MGVLYNPNTFVWEERAKSPQWKISLQRSALPLPCKTMLCKTICDKRTFFSLPSSVPFLVGVASAGTCHTV